MIDTDNTAHAEAQADTLTPTAWEAMPYGEHWSFAYSTKRGERDEYDFRVEFDETVSEVEERAVISLIEAAPKLLIATETALTRLGWVIELVSKAVGFLNLDDIPQGAIELLDEVTSSEYFKQDIESVQLAIAEAKGSTA